MALGFHHRIDSWKRSKETNLHPQHAFPGGAAGNPRPRRNAPTARVFLPSHPFTTPIPLRYPSHTHIVSQLSRYELTEFRSFCGASYAAYQVENVSALLRGDPSSLIGRFLSGGRDSARQRDTELRRNRNSAESK